MCNCNISYCGWKTAEAHQQSHRQLPSKSTSDGVISGSPVSKALTREKPGLYLEAKQHRAGTETTQCPVQNKEKRLIFAPFHTRGAAFKSVITKPPPLLFS